MILYGAGGHAKSVYGCLESQGIELEGIFDDDNQKKSFYSLAVTSPYSASKFSSGELIISIGSNKIRRTLIKSIKHTFGIAIHKTVCIAKGVKIGDGSVLLARSIIQPDALIGVHSIINTGAIVEHDCIINDFVHVGPGAVVCGDARVGEGAFIGANATILPGVSIGKWVIVGAGAVVLHDVPDGEKIVGNPAKSISY